MGRGCPEGAKHSHNTHTLDIGDLSWYNECEVNKMIKDVMIWIEGSVRVTMVGEDGEYMIDESFDLNDNFEYDRMLAMYGDRRIDFMEGIFNCVIRIEIL